MTDPIALFGLTPLPADQTKLKPATTTPQPVSMTSLRPPSTPLAVKVDDYCKSHLDEDTYRHSLRVYSFWIAFAIECFSEWDLRADGGKLDETWFACAMLHDAGTPPLTMDSTRLSYEFWAGIFALEFLQQGAEGATRDQAESVAEALIQHQDIQPVGNVTLLTTLIQLVTLFDNLGTGSQYVHPTTNKTVVGTYSTEGWRGCFKGTVGREMTAKPWAKVPCLAGFEKKLFEESESHSVWTDD